MQVGQAKKKASRKNLFCPGDRANLLVPPHLCAAVNGAELRRPLLGHAFHYGLELAAEDRYWQDHGSACCFEAVEGLLHRGPICGEPSTDKPAKSLPQGRADATASHSRSRDTFGGKSGHELQDRRRSGTWPRPRQGGTSTEPAPMAVRAERQRRGRRRAVGAVGSMVPGALSPEVQRSSASATVQSGHAFAPRARRRLRDIRKGKHSTTAMRAALYWWPGLRSRMVA